MAEKWYPTPRTLQVGASFVEIKSKRANHGIKRDLRNFFSNYALDRDTGMFEGIEIPAGAIEDLVIRRTLEEVSINGSAVQFTSPSPVDDLPAEIGMGDEEGEDSVDLYEEILKTIVDTNRFLADTYPFNMVFAQYLALVKRDKRDYEEKQSKKSGAKVDDTDRTQEEVRPNPTESPKDTSTVQRISGSDITQTPSSEDNQAS